MLFTRKVAPILSAKCVSCHRSGNLKGGFNLTTRVLLLKGGDGGAVVVPGNAAESLLYTRAISQDGQPPEMPAKGEPLSPTEAAALKEWITAGAPWPDGVVLKEKAKADANFWSLQPIAESQPPAAVEAPPGWSSNPIDRFIIAGLRHRGLPPNPPANARAFIRRATYDLTGLPPTPEEVAGFVEECGAGLPDAAVERLVDRLLSRPQYGERWGRHWLDVIRFGESRGYERNEIIRNLWPFRDYVIKSFNDDKPFDRLILEHLAGDVVGKDQPEVEVGSAFLVAGPYDDVGNQDAAAAAQIRADQIDEMIRATGEAFLGLTLGCARCHDHKFDPLLASDYYAMYATFAGTVHGQREVATTAARREREEKLAPLTAERSKLVAEREQLDGELTRRANEREAEAAKAWIRPKVNRYGTEEKFAPVEARYIRLSVEGTDSDEARQSRFKLDEFEVWTDEPTSRNVALASLGGKAAGEAASPKDFSGGYGAALVIDGKFGERWQPSGSELVITLSRAERINRAYFSSDRTRAVADNYFLTTFVGDYTIDVSTDGKAWQTVANSQDRAPPSMHRKLARLRKLVTTADDTAKLTDSNRRIAELDKQIAAVPPLSTWWVGNHQPAPGPYHVFVGGSPQRKGDAVTPASLQVLGPLASAYRIDIEPDDGARRVALARWLTAADNPLTPRVLANRVWQYHFGRGIVDTPSDFGYLGSRPTHPELLDWLASELLRNGWKLKPLHRLIMTSQTYRQSAAWREEAASADAESLFLWRFPPRRLAAEEIRDTLLSVAGKLDLKMGGPGFQLYEYQQDNVATYVPLDAPGPETYRRAVYHHNARASRVDVISDFDCPDPAFAEARRASTTSPLQALTLMNHRFSLDMTQFLAERLERDAADVPGQVRRAFQLAFGREPSDREREQATALITAHGRRAFCRAIINANELIYLE